MIEFLDMGKHAVFVYSAYTITIIALFMGYILPHIKLKKILDKKKNDIKQKK
ncbi:MAG: heme exporter protein CcmD [Pseudomonadota bacterium]|nr:heme exporter protein CcmD [Pseudomonadota bacterium]|tara:strand:+ start:4402 stop:4557 length:156 start_codon:yes stop_codon:yes gene_type:complete